MSIVTDFLTPFIGINGFGNNPAGIGGKGLSTMAESSSTRLSWREQRSTEITLLTADGDKVTLSSNSDRQASYQIYNASGTIDGTTTSARTETFNLSSGKSLSISVQGELSEQELADIALVVSTVDTMATEFFSGDINEALTNILESNSVGTLSSVSTSMTHTRSFNFSYESLSVLSGAPAEGSAAPEAATGTGGATIPPPQVTAPQGAATQPEGVTTGAVPNVASPAHPGEITLESTLGFINEMSSSVQGLGIDFAEIEEEIYELMDELFEELSKEQDPAKAMDKLVHFVKDEFLYELREIFEDAVDDDHDDDHHDKDHKVDGDHDDDHHAAPQVATPAAASTATPTPEPTQAANTPAPTETSVTTAPAEPQAAVA